MARPLSVRRLEIGKAEGDQRAARGRRRVQRHRGASVPPIKRLAPLDAIAREIVMGQMAAEALRLGHDRLADIAVDEQPRAVLGKPVKRLGQAPRCGRSRRPSIGLPPGAKMRATPGLAVRIGAMTVNR